jgi:heme/copper-type cytochrome/quinol oxidase subunit 2
VLIVEHVFPNLGGDPKKDGTISQVVRQDHKTNIILITTLSVIAVMIIVIAVLTYCLFRVVKKRSMKQSQEKLTLNYQKV